MAEYESGRLGSQGEKAAVQFLRAKGLKILATRHRNNFGEIDVIAEDGDTTVFVEVKTRSSEHAGQPFEAVDRKRQNRMSRAALAWLKQNNRLERRCRLDLISIIWPKDQQQPQISHYPAAFEPGGHGQMY